MAFGSSLAKALASSRNFKANRRIQDRSWGDFQNFRIGLLLSFLVKIPEPSPLSHCLYRSRCRELLRSPDHGSYPGQAAPGLFPGRITDEMPVFRGITMLKRYDLSVMGVLNPKERKSEGPKKQQC